MSFQYNRINPRAIDSVELINEKSDEWWEYKKSIFDDGREVPESRQEIIDGGGVKKYERILNDILYVNGTEDFVEALLFDGTMWHYVENSAEVIEHVKRNGWRSEIEVEINESAPVKFRGLCRHSRNDSWRDDDRALCCWECSDQSNNRPEKFMSSDDPVDQCELSVVHPRRVLSHVQDNLKINERTYWGRIFSDAGFSANAIASTIGRLSQNRKEAVKVAFKAAFPEYKYHYNRAEAILRDVDSKLAVDPDTGKGGERFEDFVRHKLESIGYVLSDDRVFKIKFDENAHKNNWNHFVSDPSELTYKEADVIIDGTVGPIICEVFTDRSVNQKRKQLENYAEFYELATGVEPKTWMITTDVTELLTVDSILRIARQDEFSGKSISLGDFIDDRD